MIIANRNLLFFFTFLFVTTGVAFAEVSIPREEGALAGLESTRAVFDVRTESPKSLLFILKVIEETRVEMTERRAGPHFVLAFRGGTLPLLTANPKVESDADRAILEEVRERLTDLRGKGVHLEACNVAETMFKIKREDLADSLALVSNSLISLIAYQNKGYALVPMY